jgi:hypothetical protein
VDDEEAARRVAERLFLKDLRSLAISRAAILKGTEARRLRLRAGIALRRRVIVAGY